MEMKNKNYYINQLLTFLKEIYKKNFNEKIPNTLNKLSKNLLTKYPNCIFFKTIEIKSFIEKPDEELDKCFPGNYYPVENDQFKNEIYEFLSNNSKKFQDNTYIINGIKEIINKLKNDGFIKRYINLIDIFAKKMNNEKKLLCELLVSNPLKYTELISFIDKNLNITPLPKEPYEFYLISNYQSNIKNLIEYNNNNQKTEYNNNNQKTDIENLRNEFSKKIDNLNNKLLEQDKKILEQDKKILEQDKKILEQNINISDLKKDLSSVKDSLFNIQIRDIIKAFSEYLCWSLQVEYEEKSIIQNIKNAIKKIVDTETEGEKMIIDLFQKIEEYKNSGKDQGHIVKNIGFNKFQLPETIKDKYEKFNQKKPNCGIN